MSVRYPIHPDDPLPLHAQLERAIRLAIVGGHLAIGDRLPTVRQMAVDLTLNANTVARVYAELERQGILATRRGVGTFVEALPTAEAGQTRAQRAGQLRALAERFLAEAAAHGFSPTELVEQLRSLGAKLKEKPHG